MSVIYEPKGKAGEYARLATSPYRGCDHLCTYCYVPLATHTTREKFVNMTTRTDYLANLGREAAKLERDGMTGQVLLSFSCDPYGHLDIELQETRNAIKVLHNHGFSVCVLTKGGRRALRDLDLYLPGDAFATSLTLLHHAESREWEPEAALPEDRQETLYRFHEAGIPTWVSLEPVIFPDVALRIIKATNPYVNHYKVGTLNYHPQGKLTDWPAFARGVVELLESLGYVRATEVRPVTSGERSYYLKKDLAKYLG